MSGQPFLACASFKVGRTPRAPVTRAEFNVNWDVLHVTCPYGLRKAQLQRFEPPSCGRRTFNFALASISLVHTTKGCVFGGGTALSGVASELLELCEVVGRAHVAWGAIEGLTGLDIFTRRVAAAVCCDCSRVANVLIFCFDGRSW
jgi:hypothetical protein